MGVDLQQLGRGVFPDALLPLVRDRLTPGGLYAFSCAEPLAGHYGPQAQYANGHRRPELPIVSWAHPPDQWTRILRRNGFAKVDVSVLAAPQEGWVGTILGRAVAP